MHMREMACNASIHAVFQVFHIPQDYCGVMWYTERLTSGIST